jgi:MYXO-CTERM domain-containing protein
VQENAVLSVMLLVVATPAMANTFEVGPGSDLQGIFDTLAPGTEVILSDGTYPVTTTLTISEKSGTEAAPIVIRAADGATPILRVGPDLESGEYTDRIFYVENSNWVELRGLTIQGDETASTTEQLYGAIRIESSSNISVIDSTLEDLSRSAVYLSGDNNGVVLDHTEIAWVHSGHGIYVGASDATALTSGLVIQNCLIHNVLGEDVQAITLNHGTSGTWLIDNVIYNITDRGIFLGSTEGGEQNLLEGNAIWNLGDVGINVQGSTLVRNNIIFNTGTSGIITRDPDRGTFTDVVITYNTVVDNDGWAADLEGWDLDEGHILANNALCNPMSYGVYMEKVVPEGTDPADIPTPGIASSNYVCGLVDGLDEALGEVVAGGGYADFENVELWDFYPIRDSLLVDAANPSGTLYPPSVDFNGIAREGDAPDVGAYEWDGDGNPGWAIQEDFKDFEITEETIAESVESGCCSDESKSSESGLLLLPFLGLGAGLRRRRKTTTED